MKKITDFEYILKRRQLEPNDFLNYMKYMISLDTLRVTRIKKIEKEFSQNKEKSSLFRNIQAAFIRHISYIFERAIRRFSTNLGLWQDYITFLKQPDVDAYKRHLPDLAQQQTKHPPPKR